MFTNVLKRADWEMLETPSDSEKWARILRVIIDLHFTNINVVLR